MNEISSLQVNPPSVRSLMVELIRVCLESVPSAVVRSSFRDLFMCLKSTSIHEKGQTVKFTLLQAMKVPGGGGIVLLFL